MTTLSSLPGNPICAPDNPAHLMWVKPMNRRVTISRNGRVLARTTRALRVTEMARDLYPPMIYVPREDVSAGLIGNSKTTHCPLKGDARYFDLGSTGQDGGEVPNIAWAYDDALDSAAVLVGHVAFDPGQVDLTDSPA